MGNPTPQEPSPAATNAPVANDQSMPLGLVAQPPATGTAPITESSPPPYVGPPQGHPQGSPDAVTPAANATPAPPQTSAKGVAAGPIGAGAPALAYPVATPLSSLGEVAQPVDCPFCGMRGMSTVEGVHSSLTHMSAVLCCLLCICLVFVPYAAGFGDDTEHKCGSCKKLLAISRNNGRVEVVAFVPPQTVNAQPQQPANMQPANMPTYS